MNVLKSIFTLGIILLCGACTSDLLDLKPRQTSDITVKELIGRMSKATDPKGKYRNCSSYLMKHRLSIMQSDTKDIFTTEIRFQAPNKMRITTFKDNRPYVVEIYNAGRCWHIDCASGKITEKTDPLQKELMRIYTQMGTPSLSAPQIFKNVSVDMYYEGNEKIYRLICDPGVEGIAPYVQYVNGQTYLQVRMDTIMYINGLEFLYINVPSDYAWYQDIRLPMQSAVTLMDDTRISKMIDFQLNPYFPPSNFLPPKRVSDRKIKRPVKAAVQKIKAKIQAKKAEKKATSKTEKKDKTK